MGRKSGQSRSLLVSVSFLDSLHAESELGICVWEDFWSVASWGKKKAILGRVGIDLEALTCAGVSKRP